MKTSTNFGFKWMIMAGMILLQPFLGGCQDDGLPDGEGAVVSLNQIPDNPGYTSLPLIGTKWKLVGFVDGKINRIRMAKPEDSEIYTLTFEETGEIRGYTSTNAAYGKYSIRKDSGLLISDFHNITEINEVFDGIYFIESMKRVYSYRISSKGPELYSDSQKHLLFEPLE